jgi:CheY-like chemotaxis protein
MARFLIVEDEPTVSVTFARMLEMEGHQVTLVDSGGAGLRFLESDVPDAVILDIRMPDMDGVEFLRRIRGEPRVRHVPVGIVTGDYFLKTDLLAELDALGATVRYKPLWYDDVAALAAQLLTGGRA